MSVPLAYFISWTTYGTWLHGEARGWVESGTPGIQDPDPERHAESRRRLSGPIVTLNAQQREIVAATIRAHCQIRNWVLHAVNPRTNHVHVVVTAIGVPPETVMEQFKAWCSRRLNEHEGYDAARSKKKKWWTEHGSTKWINDEEYLHNAIQYVVEGQ